MRRTQTIAAMITAAAMLLAIVAPATARDQVGIAKGTVEWALRGGAVPGIVSEFRVRDGEPGTDSQVGDGGTYHLYRPGPVPGTLTIDVSCVRVEDGWAEFAGVTTEATGVYVEDEVWLVSVVDGGRGWTADDIGMKSKGFDEDAGCAAALDEQQFGRKGVISGGNIKIRTR